MIGTEYKRRQHLSKEINSIVSVMSAISNLDDVDILWINDNLSYFKRNLLDMTFHKIDNDSSLYHVSEFAFEQMETSFKYQYYLNDMEKRRVQHDAYTNMK